jgi:hypothetical protein
MERIVKFPDGSCVRFKGEVVPDAWEVRTWASNGVLERSARPVIRWEEDQEVPRPLSADEQRAYYREEYKFEREKLARLLKEVDEEEEEKRVRDLQRSASRAKTKCRRAIITERFNELLTLTYRENQSDRELCKKHFAAWVRRMKRALGTFRFCAAFEVQERGAMHVHVATHKLPEHADYKGVKIEAWKLGTRIWRDIVGQDNGMCFVGAKTRHGGGTRRRRLSLAKMAAYVSKYILKDCGALPPGSHRYQRSLGSPIEKPTVMRFDGCTLRDVLELVYEVGTGGVCHALRVGDGWSRSVWFSSESPPV